MSTPHTRRAGLGSSALAVPFVVVLLSALSNHSPIVPPSPTAPAVEAAGRGNPAISFSDGAALDVWLGGTPASSEALGRPLALATGDFDDDGTADLLAGFDGAAGPCVLLLHGNPDAVYPYSDDARARRAAGRFTDAPFFQEATRVALPTAPRFMATGDFDADGALDLATASGADDALVVVPGDGAGGFGAATSRQLPGPVTALASGDVDRRDGLADLAIGVRTKDGGRVLLYESPRGALSAPPEIFSVAAGPSALALAQLDAHWAVDVAAAVGSQVIVFSGRDRQLVVRPALRSHVAPAHRSTFEAPAPIATLAAGDFVGDGAQDLALGLGDGTVALLDVAQRRLFPTAYAFPLDEGAALQRLRVSTYHKDDLAVVDPTGREIRILDEEHFAAATSAGITSRPEEQPLPSVIPQPVVLSAISPPVAMTAMRLNVDALSDLVLLQQATPEAPSPIAYVRTEPMTTYVVDDPGTDYDACTENTDKCTLIAALNLANQNPGHDLITFAVDHVEAGNYNAHETVTIDGTSMGHVFLEGDITGMSVGYAGYDEVDDSVVRGLHVNSLFVDAANAIIERNIVGMNSDLTACTSGRIWSWGDGSVVGGGAGAAANVANAVEIKGSNVVFAGNVVGTNPQGTAPVCSWLRGIGVLDGEHVDVLRNVIGGPVSIGSTDVLVQGNRIGTDRAGNVALGAGGITVNGPIATIGGSSVADGNVVSGSETTGIWISRADSVIVRGNRIGTNAAGDEVLGNHGDGISIDGTSFSVVGGPDAGSGNVIGGNEGEGIRLNGGGKHVVQGNFIGTGADGQTPMGSPYRSGIIVTDEASALIGGEDGGNVIANNAEDGVRIGTSDVTVSYNHIFGNAGHGIGFTAPSEVRVRNRFSHNVIHDNGRLGISLGSNYPGTNDQGDADEGVNNRQNYPVLSQAGQRTVRATLDSTPNTAFTVEIYGSGVCDDSGNGEGEFFLGEYPVVTDGDGQAHVDFQANVSSARNVLTATATDPAGNTSDFSACEIVEPLDEFVIRVMTDPVLGPPAPIAGTTFDVGSVDLSDPQQPFDILDVMRTDTEGLLHVPEDMLSGGSPFFLRYRKPSRVAAKGHHEEVNGIMYELTVDNLSVDRSGNVAPAVLESTVEDTTETFMEHTLIGINLVVSIEWKATAAYVQNLEKALRSVGAFLFDLTNGHVYLNQVAVYDDKANWDDADIRINADNTEWPSAHVDGLRSAGDLHVFLPPRWFGNGNATINGTYTEHPLRPDVYMHYATMSHELGHYAFGLYDEYIDGNGGEIYPDAAGTQRDINFSFMDSQYDAADPMSTEMSAFVTPEYRSTKQFSVHGEPAWDYFRRHFRSVDGTVPADLHTPASMGMQYPEVMAGPDDPDVRTWMRFVDRTSHAAGTEYEHRIVNTNNVPLGGIKVAIVKPGGRTIHLGKSVLAQADRGKIRLLGADPGDNLWGYQSRGNQWVQVSTVVQAAASKTTQDVVARPIDGRFTMLAATRFRPEGGLRFEAETNTALFSTAQYRLMRPEGAADGPMLQAGMTYTADLPNVPFGEAQLVFSAADSAGSPFFVPNLLTRFDLVPGQTWYLPPSQNVELFFDAPLPPISRIALLSSDFPAPTVGLPDSVARVSPVYAFDATPTSAGLPARLLIRYDADSLLAAVEEAVAIYHWTDDRWEVLPSTAVIDPEESSVTAFIEETGFYAAYLDLTRVAHVGVERDPFDEQGPQRKRLNQNYPNPFSDRTTIPFQLTATAPVRITVYDVLGREVARLADDLYPAGRYNVTFDAAGLSPGIYFCRIAIGREEVVQKMVLMR